MHALTRSIRTGATGRACASSAAAPPHPPHARPPHGRRPAAPPRRRLKLHRAWWSSKPRKIDLTVATGLTPTRLPQLEAQCLSWRGPLSAAIYLVLHDGNAEQLSPSSQESLQYATNHVQELFD